LAKIIQFHHHYSKADSPTATYGTGSVGPTDSSRQMSVLLLNSVCFVIIIMANITPFHDRHKPLV